MSRIFIFISILIFVGCNDAKQQISEKNDTIPSDIPISISETNTTIDENFPPLPVMEKPNE